MEEEYGMGFVTSFERLAAEEKEIAKLLRLIELRFGEEVKERYAAKIEQAPSEQIEQWFDRAANANRIEDVFADD